MVGGWAPGGWVVEGDLSGVCNIETSFDAALKGETSSDCFHGLITPATTSGERLGKGLDDEGGSIVW